MRGRGSRALLRRLEGRPWDLTLPDDRKQRADLQLGVMRDGDSHGTGCGMASLHDDVAPASSNFSEAVLLEDLADFASREDTKSTHVSAGIALRRCARVSPRWSPTRLQSTYLPVALEPYQANS